MRYSLFKKHEFRPDRQSGQLSKLWPTPKQQLRILRWILYGLVCLVGLLMQDVALYRIKLLGACADLLPCLVMMVAIIQGIEQGSVFALVASVLYYFSGSAPGVYVIPLLTAVTVLTVMFRHAFLRRGFWTVLLASALGLTVYELSLFAISLFLGLTIFSRIGVALLTVVMSLMSVPLCYPVLMSIGKLGGEAWGE